MCHHIHRLSHSTHVNTTLDVTLDVDYLLFNGFLFFCFLGLPMKKEPNLNKTILLLYKNYGSVGYIKEQ